MANRRMFSIKICQSYLFLAMSAGAQALYLAILGICDDDGIFQIDFAKRIAGRRKQDIDALIENGYIAIIDSRLNLGYVVDWHSFNDLKADRSTPSIYRQALVDTFPNIRNRLFTPKKNSFGIQNDSLNQTKPIEIKPKQSRTNKVYRRDFEQAWNEYPRQEGRQSAFNCYVKSRRAGATAQEILDGVKGYAAKMRHEKRKEQYIKTGSNFFREELWKEKHSIRLDPKVKDDSDVLKGLLP